MRNGGFIIFPGFLLYRAQIEGFDFERVLMLAEFYVLYKAAVVEA